MRDSELVIDRDALKHNYFFLKSLLHANSFFCPMVKADAYGMGANAVVDYLFHNLKCESFGVALIKEAISLRQCVPGQYQILVFSNFKHEDLQKYEEFNLTPVVSSLEELRILESFGWSKAFHIKYNVGINRLSELKLADTSQILDLLRTSSVLRPQAICSHLSHAENVMSENSKVYQQAMDEFQAIKKQWAEFDPSVFFHLYNSAGLIGESQKASPDINVGARVGLSLYGVAPDFVNSSITAYAEKNLVPVFQCRAKIIREHHIKKGEGTSYGWSWVATQDSRIGVIPLGYADGLKRCLSNQFSVWIGRQEVPLVGTICMDYCMVDLTKLSQKEGIGSDVLFFSPDKLKILSIKKMAKASHSIPYEIMTGWGHRLQRTYIGDA